MPTISMTVPERDILDAKRLEKLLSDGLNPSSYCQFGYYPLEVAALRRNVESVRLLLAAGAIPDVAPEKTRPSNVMAYATKGSINPAAMTQICQMLVSHGANPNGNDKQQESPLHAAVKNLNYEAVKTLAWLGADIEEVAVSKMFANEAIGTPLRRARMALSEPMMITLLSLGAKDDCLSESGYTAFQECVKNGMNQVVEYYVKERGERLDQTTAAGQTLLQIAKKEPTKRLLRSLMTEADVVVVSDEPAGIRYKPSRPLFSI